MVKGKRNQFLLVHQSFMLQMIDVLTKMCAYIQVK